MGKYEDKKTYIHYAPPVRVVPEWEKGFNFYLVESMEQLEESFKGYLDGSRIMAFDTETSSLDPESGKIVGFSYCLDGKKAYYVAVDHCIDTYNLGDEAMDFIYEMLCASKRVIMFNARFDVRMMEYYGYTPDMGRFLYVKYDMSKIRTYDVSVPCWLSDTNVRLPSLKDSALRFLGYKMQTYAEVSDGVENFYYIDPKDCFFYASSDALCTYLLVGATSKFFQEAPQINKLDMAVLYPLLHCENERVYLDGKLLNHLEVQCVSNIEQLEKEIYDEVGYHFNLNSPAQVSQAFSRLGIDTKSTTKTGYMKTGIDDLEALPEDVKNQHPALAKFIKYKSMFKFTSSYVKVLQKCYRDKGYLRSSYKTQVVPTGRLASGKDSKNTFFSEINTQSIPKPHPRFFYVVDLGDRTLFNKKDNTILGYQFIPVKYQDDDKTQAISGKELFPENFLFVVEGMDQDYNVRASFLPKFEPEQEENDIVFCSIDFASQELRIVANFSHESVWVNAFKNGEDLHKSTAQIVWGEDNYDKDKRKLAKGVNFCETDSNFVYTDRGLVRPSCLREGDKIVNRFGDKQDFQMEIVEEQPCIEVLYSNGIIARYHENHRLLVWDGKENKWVMVKDIKDEHIIQGRVEINTSLDDCEGIDFNAVLDKRVPDRVFQLSLEKRKYYMYQLLSYQGLSTTDSEIISSIALLCSSLHISTRLDESGKLMLYEHTPIKILKKIEALDTIYAIEVPSHEYISSGCISHNSVIYGAEALSFVGDGKTKEKPEGMTLAEAEEFFESYKKGLPSLFSYQSRLVRTCRQRGIVYSFFGRPRRVKYYFDNRQIGFGKRTILNNPVQSSAGDVLKMVMCKLWRLVLNHPDYMDDVKFRSTVHDEINFGIKKERLTNIARELEKTMTFEIVEWEIPLTVEVSFGWTWGGLFSFVWDDYKQQYVPKES